MSTVWSAKDVTKIGIAYSQVRIASVPVTLVATVSWIHELVPDVRSELFGFTEVRLQVFVLPAFDTPVVIV
jgi:hypothetical protein